VVVIAGATLAALATRATGTATARPPDRAVSVGASLSPHVALFGAAVVAELRVRLDPKRVDPRSVRLTVRFTPFSLLGRPRVRVESGDGATVVRVSYRLQCLAAACSHPGGQAIVRLPPALVRWGTPARLARVRWPRATVDSRLTLGDAARPSLRYTTTAPDRRYRVDPAVVGWTAVGGSSMLLLALGALAPGRLRRRPAAGPPPRSELEQALARLERAGRASQAERRAAIGALAHALEDTGFAELAPLARRLAWSSCGPSPAVANELALLVRAALEVAA
jgi:hypothetical protein